MHELSIAQSLLEIVLDEGRRHQLVQVRVVKLKIGALAAVVPDSLNFCFEMVSQGTVASGAVLDIETVPVVSRCTRCNVQFQVENHVYLCPECGEPALDLVSGRDLALVSIEGETGEGYDAD